MATDRNDELLVKLLARQDDLLAKQDAMVAVLGDIRDRLPVPAPAVGGEPDTIQLREPATPDAGDAPAADIPTRKPPARRKASAKTSEDTP